MYESILQYLQRCISELINCDEDEVIPDAKLVEDLGFESIDFLELSMTLSQEYRFEIDDKALFLSQFRPLIESGSRDEVLQNLVEAYPHLEKTELEAMLREAPRGNVLKVSHLARYIEHHAGRDTPR